MSAELKARMHPQNLPVPNCTCLLRFGWEDGFCSETRRGTPMLLLIIVLVLLFGGGGGYYGYSRWGSGGGVGDTRHTLLPTSVMRAVALAFVCTSLLIAQTGNQGTGKTGKPAAGAAGQPTTGAAGQPTTGAAGQPT